MINLKKNPVVSMKDARSYDLKPSDSHVSFWGKAVVIEAGNIRMLRSYRTIVAYIDGSGKFHRTWEGWSATTGRHIKAFGGPRKAEWVKMPVEAEPEFTF